MKNSKKTPLAAAMGTVVMVGLVNPVNAETNPFAMTALQNGYMQVAVDTHNKVNESGCGSSTTPKPQTKSTEGGCGEGRCGAMMENGKMKKGMEGQCGAMMKGQEGACGMMGMSPSDKKHDGDHKATEAGCGAMMHGGKEGACGAKVPADKAAGH
jgi:uncharacterized low-complexity protein